MNECFLNIINMSISASWLVLAVLLLRFVLRKAPKWVNVLLWGIVAVRLLCPFSFESALSLIPSAETIPLNIGMDATPTINSGINAINNAVNPIISQSNTPMAGASVNPLQITIGILEYIWVFGMIALALYTAISYWRLRRKVDTAVRYKDNIFQSENVSSPFVLGIIKPRIYLPFNMNVQDLEHVVAHEQAHIRRKDHWWKPLGFLLLTIHWFNPLMWLAYVLLCRDIELACDEKVIKELGNEQRADYTQALVACSVNRRMIAACPLAFGKVGVKERVKSVMNYKKPAFWIVVLAVIACVVVAVCFLTNPKGSTIYDIYRQDGYTVIDQEEVDVTLYVDKSKLPDSIYTAEGYEFEENEVVVYSTETTKVYLYKAMISNESDDLLYFIFDFSYDFPKAGSIISPYKYTGEHDGTQSNLYLRSKDLRDVSTAYPDALNIRGYGPGTQFAFYVSKDACQTADERLMIDIVCNQIVYAKEGHGYESQQDSSSKVRKWFDYTEDPSQMSYESELKIQFDEFPDITFRYTPYEIITTTSWDDSELEGHTILISGMPIWNAYFADLTGDDMPELCSSLSMGSGMIDNRVIIFDYANGISYKLEDRGSYDYYLRMDDTNGCLYVDKKVYRSGDLVSSGKLVFKDGYIQLEGENTDEITPNSITFEAEILEIRDGSYLVKPESSWAINSADLIEVPMKKLDPALEPQLGDIIEISYGGGILETYPARIKEVYSIRVVKEAETWDLIPMVMVNGTLYLDTGCESDVIERTDHFDGEITSQVDGSKRPSADDQSNFGTGYGYHYGKTEGPIELFMNGKWWLFATEALRQALPLPTSAAAPEPMIPPVVPVSVTNLITGEETILTSDADIRTIQTLISTKWWAEGSPACDNNFKIACGEEIYWYHSDCGAFTDAQNDRYITLSEEQLTEINRICSA